jgi:hypothetical protein
MTESRVCEITLGYVWLLLFHPDPLFAWSGSHAHRTQGEITLGHKCKNKRAWRSMLFWLSAKPWAKNLMPKENMFWLFCQRLNYFLTSWPRVGYFALVLDSFSSWLFCLGPRVIFCLAIPYTMVPWDMKYP